MMGMKQSGISVIIAYYRNLPFLELVLEGLKRQSLNDFEVILAEDDNNPETLDFLEMARDRYLFPLKHVSQETKKGFRKTTMLNKALRISAGMIIVFLDGDTIPHRHLLRQYAKNITEGYFASGRRVLLGEKLSSRLLSQKTLSLLRPLPLIFSDSRLLKEGIYFPWFGLHLKMKKLSGCNWGAWKPDLIRVNGFDEDYVRPGVGEDHDIEWRLLAAGVRKRSIKNRAIAYHLHHAKLARPEDVKLNNEMLREKMGAERIRCIHGLTRPASSSPPP